MPYSIADFHEIMRDLNVSLQMMGYPEIEKEGRRGRSAREAILEYMKHAALHKDIEQANKHVVDALTLRADEFLFALETDIENGEQLTGFIPIRELFNMFNAHPTAKKVDPRYRKKMEEVQRTLELCRWTYNNTPIRVDGYSRRGYLKRPNLSKPLTIWRFHPSGHWVEQTPNGLKEHDFRI